MQQSKRRTASLIWLVILPAVVASGVVWAVLTFSPVPLPSALTIRGSVAQGSHEQPPVPETPPYDQALLRALAEQMRPAETTIEVDSRMVVGRQYEATLIVDRASGKRTLAITETTEQPVALSIPVEVTSEASARATSSAMRISSNSPDWQSLTSGAPAVWSWTIEPVRSGPTELTFALYQKVRMEGTERVVFVDRYPRNVTVEVSGPSIGQIVRGFAEPINFLSSLAGLIAAVYGFWVWRRRRRQAAAAAPAVTEKTP